MKKLRAVHYLNQFYGQIGGEDKAHTGFSVKEGLVGPGILLQKALGDQAEIVGTVICGDNYFAEKPKEAGEELLRLVAPFKPDIFFAGPAFAAGRYGIACGHACKVVGEAFGIPVFTGMHEESPGVDVYRSNAYIVKTHNSVAKIAEDMEHMVRIAKHVLENTHGRRFVSGFGIGTPEKEGYFPQMMIRNVYTEKKGATRAVDMVLAKIAGKPFKTELEYPQYEPVEPPKPIADMRSARIAVVSDGGLADPKNKGGLKGRSCGTWTSFDLNEFMAPGKTRDDYVVYHEGYFHEHVLQDRNRIIPYDVLKEFEQENLIGKLNDDYFVTGGNSTVMKWCGKMGEEIAVELKKQGVDGVILTST